MSRPRHYYHPDLDHFDDDETLESLLAEVRGMHAEFRIFMQRLEALEKEANR